MRQCYAKADVPPSCNVFAGCTRRRIFSLKSLSTAHHCLWSLKIDGSSLRIVRAEWIRLLSFRTLLVLFWHSCHCGSRDELSFHLCPSSLPPFWLLGWSDSGVDLRPSRSLSCGGFVGRGRGHQYDSNRFELLYHIYEKHRPMYGL